MGRADEADLVEALRAEGAVLLSLVAEVEARVTGHILFSRVWIDGVSDAMPAVALAPMAVLPECQSRGVGTALVQHGLQMLRTQGEQTVFVLGHSHFYQRFGFSTAAAALVQTPFPRESFMGLELSSGAIKPLGGTARYAKCFGL